MIEILLGVLLAISTNTACDYGKPVDWYAYTEAHPYYHHWDLSSKEYGDVWLIDDYDGEYYLFVFAQPIADTIATGASHGKCFQYVGSVNDHP